MSRESKLYLFRDRKDYIIKRRKNVFRIYHEIENIIDDLDIYQND